MSTNGNICRLNFHTIIVCLAPVFDHLHAISGQKNYMVAKPGNRLYQYQATNLCLQNRAMNHMSLDKKTGLDVIHCAGSLMYVVGKQQSHLKCHAAVRVGSRKQLSS